EPQTFPLPTATLQVPKETSIGIPFDDGTFPYDGTAHEITIGGTLPQGTSVAYTGNTRTDAGSQTATAVINGGNNYDGLTLTATLTVTKRTDERRVGEECTSPYDGSAHETTMRGRLPRGSSAANTRRKRTP